MTSTYQKYMDKKQTNIQQWSLAYCSTVHKLKENYAMAQQHKSEMRDTSFKYVVQFQHNLARYIATHF